MARPSLNPRVGVEEPPDGPVIGHPNDTGSAADQANALGFQRRQRKPGPCPQMYLEAARSALRARGHGSGEDGVESVRPAGSSVVMEIPHGGPRE